ncbi:MAG: carboxypeptidase-like regulatory domain-containing protein [Longimicrobiales bacterium]
MRHRSTALAVIAALGLLLPPAVRAQSVVWGAVAGTVVSVGGQPVPRALVTLSTGSNGTSQEATTDLSGRFRFALLAPGTYQLRVEALGYRPTVGRGLALAGGESSSVTVRLSVAAPPVVVVDTVELAAGGSARWRPGGAHFSQADLAAIPDRFEDLASALSLESTSDRSQGALGLPGSMTVVVADGIPSYRAPHPLALSELLGDALFPRAVLAAATAYGGAPDVEWASAGGYAALATRTGGEPGGLELDGAWAGGPLWSSGVLDFDAPGLTSFRGGARTAIGIGPGSSLFLGTEAFQEEAPLAARIDSTLASSLSGLDPDLVTSLTSPSIERVARYSALARGDVQTGESTRFFVRGAIAYTRRDFDGPGPVGLARDVALPEESVDFSLAGGLISEYQPGTDVELRAGVSRSSRTFDPAAMGMPPVSLAGSGADLGVVAAGAGSSSRTDFFLMPSVHRVLAVGQLKAGVTLRATMHSLASQVPSQLIFSDGPALVADRGFARSLSTPEVSFKTQEIGAFARYDLEATPGVRISVGGRFDWERIPRSEVDQNQAWFQASGIPNDSFPAALKQAGLVGSLTWDPARDGTTVLTTVMSLQHGDLDPRTLGQLLSQDVGATSTRYAGTGLTWPGGAIPGTATTQPTLTLLGTDTRAPRSVHTSVGASQRVAPGWSVRVEGMFRRTDFLTRRRNLNIAPTAQALDPDGRDVFGTLQQDGSLVTATGTDARRFSAFQEVWALDPDGWSEYRGVTVGLDHAGATWTLFASYTLSETTDNWIGASRASPEAQLPPLLPSSAGEWSEGTSDFDVRHRAAAATSLTYGPATFSASYRFRSGLPFTPGYRMGVDANGDGAFGNDVAFVDAAVVDPLLAAWPCLSDQGGGFAARNSCRGPSEHAVDVRVAVSLGRLGGRNASLVLDGLNLVEGKDGVVDHALLLVDPTGTLATSPGSVTIPLIVNPDFGRVLYPSTRGRQLRIGFRIG